MLDGGGATDGEENKGGGRSDVRFLVGGVVLAGHACCVLQARMNPAGCWIVV